MNETYEKFKKDLALNIDSIINTISDTSTNIVGSLGAINQTNEKLLGTFNPELTTDRLGIEKYTRENTSAIPNIDYSKDIAAQLEHYEDNYSKDEITRWRVLQGTENETKENTEDINMSSQEIKENVSETKDLVGNVADSVSSIDDTHKAYSESLKVLGTDFMPTVQDDANKISEDTALLRTKGLENDEQLLENQDFSNDLSTDISTKLDVIDVGVGKLIPIESDLNIMNSYLGNILNAINSIDLTTGKNSPLNLMSSNISAGLIKSSLESGTKSATTAFAAKSKSTPNVNVESLIHVEGNVDEGVVGKIDEIAKGLINNTKFTNNMYSYITKETSKENKKRY